MIDVANTLPAQGDAPVRHGRILREPRRRHRGADRPTGPEMVKMAVDWEYERRRNSKLHRLRRHAALAQPDADVADLKVMPGRSVDTELIARLAVGSYLAKHQDVDPAGPDRGWEDLRGLRAGQQGLPAVPHRALPAGRASCSTASPSPNAPARRSAASTRSSRSSC